MQDIVIVVSVPATKSEPAHTKVWRYEIKEATLGDIVMLCEKQAIEGGRMQNKPYWRRGKNRRKS